MTDFSMSQSGTFSPAFNGPGRPYRLAVAGSCRSCCRTVDSALPHHVPLAVGRGVSGNRLRCRRVAQIASCRRRSCRLEPLSRPDFRFVHVERPHLDAENAAL